MKIREFSRKIELTNNGGLSLFFLGTGGAFSKKLYQNNLLVIKGSDHLLIDCGSLCPLAFHSFNSDITDIKNYIITHSHADHVGGLEEVALMNMYVTKRRPNVIITNSYKKTLWENTLKGGLGIRGENGHPKYLKFEDYFMQICPSKIKHTPRPMYEANIGCINVKLFRTKHIFPNGDNWRNSFYSVGVIIDDKVIFSGDSKSDMDFFCYLNKQYNPEVIFHDCQLEYSSVHASYKELSAFPKELKEKMFLCHYDDDAGKINPKQDGFAGYAQRGIYYDLGISKNHNF